MRPVHPELQAAFDWIEAHRDEAIADLQRLVQQKSVSAQNIGLEACAQQVVELMHADGLPATAYPTDGGPPCVIGHLPSRSSSKTLLAYAHYDVQPEEPVDKWSYPPYGGVIDRGRLWGRGATDNKSGVLAFIKGAKAWLQTRGDLPVGVKFLTEGEEEIGSIHLGPLVAAHPELVRADAMHCLDGGVDPSSLVPDIDLGLKSVLFVELVARGANADIHSLNAPLLPAPAWDLVRALNTLMDDQRRILVDGWYEGLWELGKEEYDQLEANAARLDLSKLRAEWGIQEFALGRDGVEALRARAYEPTCNIAGLTAGYQGAGSKTIVPNEARAKLDLRLPPLIDPTRAIEKLRRHLVERGFGHIELIIRGGTPEPPYKISVKEEISQAIVRAAEQVFGAPPVINGVSAEGTILKHVWMPTVLTGFAQPDCNLHAPDESIDLEHYIKGIRYAAAILWEYGQLAPPDLQTGTLP
ncbi:MAG: M20/M25/M40 family metallo-hydrolase [Caldilinea sp.]|jgi:acetylornithine deacetylase/succinyl-diaminopimelate desuccinylase-like protein